MFDRHSGDRGRKAVSLLATMFVLTGGLVVCLFIFVVAGERASLTFVRWGGYYVVAVLVVWLLRDKDPAEVGNRNHFWLLGRSRKQESTYSPATVRHVPRVVRYGTNEPPTAETIRMLKDEASTWVPGRSIRDTRTDN